MCMEYGLTAIIITNHLLSYHNLLPETSLPVNEEHLDHLLKIIWDCNASNKIGIIALHKHKTLPPNHSFVGYAEQAKKGYLYWIMKFANEKIDLDQVCGYKFAFVDGIGLYPFEFRKGQMLDLSGIAEILFLRIYQYLVDHDLTSRFGVMLLIPELSQKKRTELLQRRGMVLIETESLPQTDLTTVPTAWQWDPDGAGTYGVGIECQKSIKGGHVKPPDDDLLCDVYSISV
jgi:hypothetical protein